jgi:hypothetical protein
VFQTCIFGSFHSKRVYFHDGSLGHLKGDCRSVVREVTQFFARFTSLPPRLLVFVRNLFQTTRARNLFSDRKEKRRKLL